MFGLLRFSVTLGTVVISICHAHLPSPTNLKAKWIDALTVNVSWSWKRPKNLSRDCTIAYEYRLGSDKVKAQTSSLDSVRIGQSHFLETLLAEGDAKWVCSVNAVCEGPRLKSSLPTTVVIEAPTPRAAVTDFKCYLSDSDMNCSWISDPSSPVSLFYRDCGETPEILKTPFSTCSQTYKSGQRTVCHLRGDFLQKDLCMLTTSSKGNSTFKPTKAVKTPNVTISEEGTKLVLTFEHLAVAPHCFFMNVCSSVCNEPWQCKEHSKPDSPWTMPHNKSCQYKFKYRAQTLDACQAIDSDWSEETVYASTDWTMTVLAIVIPLVVSACVILSCICFRRHKDIICPEIPDPSYIFKEMINSNKEMKPNVSRYTPVQEPVEPIVIVPHIPDRSGLAPP